MDRMMWRLGIGAVLAVIVIGAKFMNKGSAGEDYRKVAHQIVAHVDGYSAKPDYYDWLADEGHDQCFSNAYHMDFSRRRDKSWIDDDQYITDLFNWMIDQAKTDNAGGVAAALEKYRTEHTAAEPPAGRRSR